MNNFLRQKYQMNPNDREHITHKYYLPEYPHNGYDRFSYHGYDYDATTGISEEEIKMGLKELSRDIIDKVLPCEAKALAISYVLNNTRIDINDNDFYIGFYSWGRIIKESFFNVWDKNLWYDTIPETRIEMERLRNSGLADIWADYDHSVPDWDAVMSLGFYGLLERVKEVRRKNESIAPLSKEQTAYYNSLTIVLDAIVKFIKRLKDYALTKSGEKIPYIISCLTQLEIGAPTNTFEALQLMYLYFMISESVDLYQVRSLGNGFDRIIYPFYKKDLENNTFTQQQLDDFIAYFLLQFYAIGNYWGQPLFLGGTNLDGTTRFNELSLRTLSIWDDLDIHNPKIQVVFGDSTPKQVRYQVYDMIRRGKYLTIVGEKGAIKAVQTALDCDENTAKNFIITGCYEPVIRDGILIECGYPNLLKLVSITLRDGFDPMTKMQVGAHTGYDFNTFNDFFKAFETQFEFLFTKMVNIANTYERYLTSVNPSLLFTSTKIKALEAMQDAYTMKDKKSFSLFELNGYGSAIDALVAIKKSIFDDKITDFNTLRTALDANWVGYENLRRYVLKCPKYGNYDEEADRIGKAVSDLIPKYIHCHRNTRGAKFICEYHGAMEYAWQGDKTEATPDGRKLGMEISKNASPSIGADVKGSTAFILSCTRAIYPEAAGAGFNADVMLHPSALMGENGLIALDALVNVYMQRNGIDIQFNVLSPDTLLDAQKNPEKYKNLQIRVSGWNVLWNDIPKVLQDAYILRAQTVTGS